MSASTTIEWTDATYSPLRARRKDTGKVGQHCERVSAGCTNCYAARHNGRNLPSGGTGLDYVRASRDLVETFVDERVLTQPLRWREPRRIFVENQSDLFADFYTDEQIDRVFAVMALPECNRHSFQILTKRPERMRSYLAALPDRWRGKWPLDGEFPLANLWVGVSVEDQKTADARIPVLLDTPAALRWISLEPMLEPVDVGLSSASCGCCARWSSRWVRLHSAVYPDLPWIAGAREDHVAEAGVYRAHSNKHGALSVQTPGGLLGIRPAEFEAFPRLDWIVVGGESGPRARPCDVAWIRSIVEQCKAASVPCFVKQVGACAGVSVIERVGSRDERSFFPRGGGFWPSGEVGEREAWIVRMRSRKGSDPSEWPADLRVRELPGGAA